MPTSSAPTRSGAPATSRPSAATSCRSIFPSAEAARAAAERIAKGHELRRDRQGARQDREGHRPRHRDQGRDDRPRRGRRGLRPQGGRGQRAGPRPVRHRAGAGAQDRARDRFAPSRRLPASSSRSSRPRAPRPRCPDLYNKIEDARSEGKTLAEAAEKLKLPRRVPSRRSTAPAAIPPASPSTCPDQQRLLAAAFTTEIGVERDPLQVAGRLHLVRRRRDHALARAPARGGEGAGRARWREQEIATRLDAKAAEILDKLKAGSTFAEVAAADRPQGRDRDRPQARPSLRAALGAADRCGVPNAPRTRSARPRRRSRPSRSCSASPISWCRPSTWPPKTPSASSRRSIAASPRTCSREYIARLESEIGVTINQSALNQVISGGAVPATSN